MRYPKSRRAETRERIRKAAARLFRKKGYAGTGVDAVMEASGLTAGAFYAHFPSKEVLLAAALEVKPAGFDSAEQPVREFLGHYLSTGHRDHPELGCPIPSLGPEVARAGAKPRRALETHVRNLMTTFERSHRLSSRAKRERAEAIAAMCVGAVLIARAVRDERLSQQMLAAARRTAAELLGLSGRSQRARA